eukprot:m.114545 g.114545  ORF g.114545 m.114545 type:complete len:91 (+) comp22937_c0_seq1:250-522(+)
MIIFQKKIIITRTGIKNHSPHKNQLQEPRQVDQSFGCEGAIFDKMSFCRDQTVDEPKKLLAVVAGLYQGRVAVLSHNSAAGVRLCCLFGG